MNSTQVLAPVGGRAVPLADVPDPVFSAGMVGHGAAIDPPREVIDAVAPVSGKLLKLMPHAYIVMTPDNVGVLVHLGLDTVSLNGDGFTAHVSQGDQVTVGQVLITYDVPSVEAKGLNPIVPVVVMDEREPGNIVAVRSGPGGRCRFSPGQIFSSRTSRWKSSSCRTPTRLAASAPTRSPHCSAANRRRCWAWPPDRRRWRSTTNSRAAATRGLISFRQARGFTLDEYVGLPADHPQRYRTVIDEVFVSKVDFAPGAVQGPDGLAADIPAACAEYETAIRDAGGVDLQILGIGTDGHIAFNEPGSSLGSRTRIKTLTMQTRMDNARFFGGDVDAVPTHCLTQGLATIMEARHLILVATGRRKAEAVHQLVEGPISALWPATILQLHPHVTVLLDEAAARRLQLVDYYRETYRSKPEWQGI